MDLTVVAFNSVLMSCSACFLVQSKVLLLEQVPFQLLTLITFFLFPKAAQLEAIILPLSFTAIGLKGSQDQ